MDFTIGEPPHRYRKKAERDMPGFRWPASRLTWEDRDKLCIMSNATKKPITQLLHEAAELLYEVFTNEG